MVFAARRQLQMADNYLENKMEEFRQGAKVVRRPSASLEGLLESLAANATSSPDAIFSARGEESTFAAIMPAQLEAVVRAAKHLPEAAAFRFEVDDAAAFIRILGPSSPRRYMFDAGQIILAMRLKAAELHLRATVEIRPDSSIAANPLLATVILSH